MGEFDSERKLPDMKKFPFTVPKIMPKSGSNVLTNNERIRNICCVNCRYQCPSHIANPICGVCGREMITVI